MRKILPFFIFLLILITGVVAQTCLEGQEKCDGDNEQRCVNNQWTKTKHCDYGCANNTCVEKTITCRTIQQGAINIVFSGLGYNQKDIPIFVHNIRNAIDFAKKNEGLLAYEPFTSSAHHFGFSYINDISLIDFEKIRKACDLPHRYDIILLDKATFPGFNPSADFQGHVRFPTPLISPAQCEDLTRYCAATDTNTDGCSDANVDADFNRDGMIDHTDTTIRKICAGSRYGCSNEQSLIAYCYPLNGVTLAHEFGHAFGHLLDEYVDLPRGQTKETRFTGIDVTSFTNCYFGNACTTEAPWNDLISKDGTGCYQGCAYDPNAYRPTDKGIMNDYTVQRYGLAEERIICQKIHQHTGTWDGYCNQFKPSIWERFWNWILALFR